jgi:hypothetical protein
MEQSSQQPSRHTERRTLLALHATCPTAPLTRSTLSRSLLQRLDLSLASRHQNRHDRSPEGLVLSAEASAVVLYQSVQSAARA